MDVAIMSSKMSGRTVGPPKGRKAAAAKGKKAEVEAAPPSPQCPSPPVEEEEVAAVNEEDQVTIEVHWGGAEGGGKLGGTRPSRNFFQKIV